MSRTEREVADLATARTAAAAAVDRLLRHCRQSTDASEVAAAEASALAENEPGALSLQESDEHCTAGSAAAASERGASQSRPGADSHCLWVWPLLGRLCPCLLHNLQAHRRPARACKLKSRGWTVSQL